MNHTGVVQSSNTTAIGPASTHTYTVLVTMPNGAVVRKQGVKPWFQQWPDTIHVEPYPPSTPVIVMEVGSDWIYLFPGGQRPKTGGCP